MPMFNFGRKARDEEDNFQTTSKSARSLTRKKKKNNEVEEKPVINIATALPDSNEFRTSLIMPNLSARFSMLREQDDPTSKIGKAADDSVLFPKRASRMNLFAHNPLTDIAEVESIRDSIRRPFAERHGSSYSDGYGSDDGGSIMNRSRPGEGNNLFGGRQKLFKITNNSQRDLSGNGSPTLGSAKHMYENDVALSAFQQYRIREKERREKENIADRNSASNPDTDEADVARSPSLGFSKNRGTQSSTNSGPPNSRTSTAATSVTSDSPVTRKPSSSAAPIGVARSKEIDVNSSVESVGFAVQSGLQKITEDKHRPQFNLSQSRSAANLRNDYSKSPTIFTSGAFRPTSPPLSAGLYGLDFGLKDTVNKTSRFNTASPTAQLESSQDQAATTLTQNIQPNDRGKATAMGLFNKPQRNFDEHQFTQRQIQMHEGRTSPFSTTSRSASRASPELQRNERKGSLSAPSPAPSETRFTPQIPPVPDYPPSPALTQRGSGISNRDSDTRSRTKSSSSLNEAAVKARVESLIRRQNAELAALEAEQLGSKAHANSSTMKEVGGTFFDNDSEASDNEQHSCGPAISTRENPPPLSPSEVHPALRDFNFGTQENSDKTQSTVSRDSNYSNFSRHHVIDRKSKTSEYDTAPDTASIDSPASKFQPGLGLSGMIRTHLRHDSDRSSLPPPSPAILTFDVRDTSTELFPSMPQSFSENVKPFSSEVNDEQSVSTEPEEPERSPTPTTMLSQKAQQILGIATALRNANPAANKSEPQTEILDQSQDAFDATSHQRNFSTETQEEQKRFDEELAERRRRINEGLKSSNERSVSPSGRNGRSPSQGLTLSQLRSRTNTGDRTNDIQPKATKVLGLNGSLREYNGPSSRSQVENRVNDIERHQDGLPLPRMRQRTSPANEYVNGGRYFPNHRQPSVPRGDLHERYPPSRSTTPSERTTRNRSTSGTGDRAMSRNRKYSDTQEHPMPGAYNSPGPKASSRNGFRSDSRGTDRSGSAVGGIYRDKQGFFSPQPRDDQQNGFTPRPSPRPDFMASSAVDSTESLTRLPMSPPASTATSPSPTFDNILGDASSGRSTPNGRATPTTGTGRVTPSGGPAGRKKSVSKRMISEPTFLSSTSSVPLIHLPQHGGPLVEPVSAPPIPVMNPRRRVNGGDEPAYSPNHISRHDTEPSILQNNAPKFRNKLRKSSSEGGNLAAKARQQALMADIAKEREKSPAIPVFPNRSATTLGIGYQDGGMF